MTSDQNICECGTQPATKCKFSTHRDGCKCPCHALEARPSNPRRFVLARDTIRPLGVAMEHAKTGPWVPWEDCEVLIRERDEARDEAERMRRTRDEEIRRLRDASGLTIRQLIAGKKALLCCSEDPTFDAVRAVVKAVIGLCPECQGPRPCHRVGCKWESRHGPDTSPEKASAPVSS